MLYISSRNRNLFRFFIILLFVTLLQIGFYSASEVYDLFKFDQTNFILMQVVSVFLLLVAYYFLFSKPLDKVAREVAAVIASKPYDRINISSKDEFGLLAYFFNDVTKNIENISFFLKEGSRMSSDLNIAADIQRSVLPKNIPVIEYLDTVAKTRSADELGGDSFDIVKHNDEYFMYIGDVTGHGAAAGLVMMVMNTLFDILLPSSTNTLDLAIAINKELKPRVNASMFMTTAFFRWNPATKKMFYTGAGHEHILIFRASEGVTESIVTGGVALAMAPDITNIAKEKEIHLNDQDIVVLYSDGITEAVNGEGELFGLDRLKESLTRNATLGASLNVFEGISRDVISFVNDTVQKDDMTLLVMRYVENGYESERQENLVSTNWS